VSWDSKRYCSGIAFLTIIYTMKKEYHSLHAGK